MFNSRQPMSFITTSDTVQRIQNTKIEGPTKTQARKMAARRAELITASDKAASNENYDLQFKLDCEIWDIEIDLRMYGFDIETGRKL